MQAASGMYDAQRLPANGDVAGASPLLAVLPGCEARFIEITRPMKHAKRMPMISIPSIEKATNMAMLCRSPRRNGR